MDERGFPTSIPEFMRAFPDDVACARHLEHLRWPDGFICPKCGAVDAPYRFLKRKSNVLRCRACQSNISLTAGTVMQGTRTPLSVWFWGAYLMTTQTPGISAVQFQRQLGLSRYETAFQILHKLRAGMVRPDQDRIGASPDVQVEADETYIGGRSRGEGRGVHHMALVAGAVEVREREKTSSRSKRRNGRYAGRVRLALLPNRGAKALGGFIASNVEPGAKIVTDDWTGYAGIGERYTHTAVAERGDPAVAETFLPIIHLVLSNLKTWLRGTHHGVSPAHLQLYLNEFVFRFNRRFYPMTAFHSILGIASKVTAPTYLDRYHHENRRS